MAAVDLSTQIAGLRLKNPVLVASGTFGFGREYSDLIDLNRLGGVVTKGLTLRPLAGNPPPRVVETPAGMLNAIGLQNPGVDVFIREELPWLAQFDVAVIANVAGHAVEEYGEVAARLDGAPGVAGLEINISCPNVKEGGMAFGVDPATAAAVTASVRRRTRLPVIVKLSPNVTKVETIARAVVDAGADALSLINTLVGMVIDVDRRRPLLANGTGGLSGPAVRPVAVRMVYEVAQALAVPIVGLGGITCARDALEFIMAGASAVAVGSALFRDPQTPIKVIDGLADYLNRHGGGSIADLVGVANPGFRRLGREEV